MTRVSIADQARAELARDPSGLREGARVLAERLTRSTSQGRDSMQFGGGDDCCTETSPHSGYAHDSGPALPVRSSLTSPRAVNCPHCGAVAGRPCMTTSGVRYRGGAKGQRTIHSARIDAFQEITKLADASAREG